MMFLPEKIKTAKEKRIQKIFIRLKRFLNDVLYLPMKMLLKLNEKSHK